jgi:hypothetical protein
VPGQVRALHHLRLTRFTMATKSLPLALALAVGLVAARPVAASITLLDTGGFEAPAFTTTFDAGGTGYAGQLEGQPIAPPEDTWQQSGPDASTATVQTAVVQSGAQAVELAYGGADTRWGVPLDVSNLGIVTVSWDMLVRGPASNPEVSLGPIFGVEAYADSTGGTTLLGSVFVDASSGEVLYQATGTGFLTPATAPNPAFLNVWNSFDLVLDYVSQTYSVFVNDVLQAGGIGFVDGAFGTFGSADLAALDAGFGVTPGFGFVDNFSIVAADVPELSTGLMWVGLASVAGGGCWWRRRRTAA